MSECEKAAVIMEARVVASESVARVMVMFGGGILDRLKGKNALEYWVTDLMLAMKKFL